MHVKKLLCDVEYTELICYTNIVEDNVTIHILSN